MAACVEIEMLRLCRRLSPAHRMTLASPPKWHKFSAITRHTVRPIVVQWYRTSFHFYLCELSVFCISAYIALYEMCFRLITARRYASAVYAMVVCLCLCVCVCVSVCPSQVGVLLKWLNIGKRKQRHTIAQGL